jgi:hypothetical protein
MKTEDILSGYDGTVAGIATQLASFLKNQLKGVIEIPDPAAKMIAYGYGPGYTDMICTILLSKKGVKLGFYKGSELPDAANLLTGSGNVHRYVEIRTAADIRNPELKELLNNALKAFQKRKSIVRQAK